MLSAVAQSLDGVHVALVADWVVEATPKALPLADLLDQEASVLQLALADSEVVGVDSLAGLAGAVEVVAVAASVVTGVSVEDLAAVAEVAEADTVVVEEVSAINPTATAHQMVHLLGHAVHEELVLVVIEEAEAVSVATVEAIAMETDVPVAAVEAMIAVPAVPTTNPSAEAIDTKTVGTVEEVAAMELETAAERTGRGNVGMKATATTIRGHEGDTRSSHQRLDHLTRNGFVKGYLPFLPPRLLRVR